MSWLISALFVFFSSGRTSVIIHPPLLAEPGSLALLVDVRDALWQAEKYSLHGVGCCNLAGLGAAGRWETVPWELDGSVLSRTLNGETHLGAGGDPGLC